MKIIAAVAAITMLAGCQSFITQSTTSDSTVVTSPVIEEQTQASETQQSTAVEDKSTPSTQRKNTVLSRVPKQPICGC